MPETTMSPQRKKLSMRIKNIAPVSNKLKKNLTGPKKEKFIKIYRETAEKESTSADELTKTEAPVSYWKKIAEERRIQLEKTLEENRDLCELLKTRNEEVTDLEAERDELLKENQILRKKAQKANELEHMIAELISSSEEGQPEDQPEDEAQAEEAKEE